MKIESLLFLLFLFAGSCTNKIERPTISSFDNKWGVIYFLEPAHFRMRNIFLPLENQADSNSIAKKSSIFDYNYGTGMEFRDNGRSYIIYKAYWLSDQKQAISKKDDTTYRIRWVFVKLKYHVKIANEHPIVNVYQYTLVNKKNEIPVKTYDFQQNIAIDTAFFKRKWVPPSIDTAKSKLRRTKPRPGSYL